MKRQMKGIKKPSKYFFVKILPLLLLVTLLSIQIIAGTAPPNSPPPPGF